MMATTFCRIEFWGGSGMSSGFDSDVILTTDLRLYRITRWQAAKTLRAAGIRGSLRRQELETRSIRRARIQVRRATLLPWPPLLAGPIRHVRFRLYPPVLCPLRTAVLPAPQSGNASCEYGSRKMKLRQSQPVARAWQK